MDLISVIVPVYKVEAYLDRCVRSIVDQTYRNLEIILVDDGSPDNCPAMCDEWAKKDSRIKVIHKPNGGLSDARNAGLAIASGEYIGFVDSDDWIALDCYSELYRAMEENNAQIAACRIVKCYGDHSESLAIDTTKVKFTPEEAISTLIHGRDFCAVVWNKLYRRSTLDQLQFPVGKLHEDEFFTYKALAKADTLVLVPNTCYYYWQRSSSIMGSWSVRHLDVLDAYNERLSFLKEAFPNLYLGDKYTFLGACAYHVQMLQNGKDNFDNASTRKIMKYVDSQRFSHRELMHYNIKQLWHILVWRGILSTYAQKVENLEL